MKNDTAKSQEEKVSATQTENDANSDKQPAEPKHDETMEERAEREGWTDTVASHLDIDE